MMISIPIIISQTNFNRVGYKSIRRITCLINCWHKILSSYFAFDWWKPILQLINSTQCDGMVLLRFEGLHVQSTTSMCMHKILSSEPLYIWKIKSYLVIERFHLLVRSPSPWNSKHLSKKINNGYLISYLNAINVNFMEQYTRFLLFQQFIKTAQSHCHS